MDRQTIIITGAGRGIGRVIALHFARTSDFNLFLISRTEEHLEQTAEQCRHLGAPLVATAAVDITDQDAVSGLELPAEMGRVRMLVNNAGSYATDSPERVHAELMRAQFDHNVLGATLTTRRFLPLLKEQAQGLIVNIGSVASYSGIGNAVAYTAAKHALLGYTRSLREFLKGSNVAVTVLMPGSTWSTSWEGSKADPQSTIDAEDLAVLIEALTRLSPRSVVEEIRVMPR